MPRYKRTAQDAELDASVEPTVAPEDVATLTKLRNMWEFASLMQYIFLFGHVVKIDEDFDIEDLEAECLSPSSEKLALIGLAMLKYVSSHRGLTLDIFDEYTRRQYLAKASSRNPFGNEEEPTKFQDMDVCTRIRVLQQLGTWTFGNVDRIRGLMPLDEDHLSWRMEPLGWDQVDRAYFVLDDNRLYRRSDTPVAPLTPESKPKSKPKSKTKPKSSAKSRATRSSKRRKVEELSDAEAEDVEADAEAGAVDDTTMLNDENGEDGYGFTDKTWECIAITIEEYNDFLASIFRSRDANEKQLRKRIEEDVLPIIQQRAEALRQKQLKKMREVANLQKMATAKRSSRLADKAERYKDEREKREADENKQRDLKMAHDEEKRIEEGHESRRLTREQRIKEREVKRILHEEELQKLQEQEERAVSQGLTSDAAVPEDGKRASGRQAKVLKEQHKKQLEELAEEEGKWYFDCSVCGINGENFEDGTHIVACDRCGVWQHCKCHGFTPKQAEKEGFSFVCNLCKRKQAEESRPKIPPLKLGKKASSGSPELSKTASRPSSASANGSRGSGLPPHVQRQLDGVQTPTGQPSPSPGPFGQQLSNGPSLSPHGQTQGPPGYRYPPVGNFAPHAPQQPWQGSPLPAPVRPPSSSYSSSTAPHTASGYDPPHNQQHQYAHQTAIANAGVHPAYHPPYPQPQYMNGYHAHAPGGQYSVAQTQPQSQQTSPYPAQQPPYPPPHSYLLHQHQRPPPSQQQQRRLSSAHQATTPYQQYQQQPPPHRPSDGQLMNSFQSPMKGAAHIASSPPYQVQEPASLHRSPKTSFPPPANTYAQYNGSPTKSSPPPQPPQQSQPPPQNSPFISTPQTLRPLSSNGQPPPIFQTPRGQVQPGLDGVAADGMAGPWPEGSKAIPQKHDQSPAPPSSAQTVGDTRILPPPVGVLTPSPAQTQPGKAGNIPVKKSVVTDVTGTPGSQQSTLAPQQATPVPQQPTPTPPQEQQQSPPISQQQLQGP